MLLQRKLQQNWDSSSTEKSFSFEIREPCPKQLKLLMPWMLPYGNVIS
jgi:hypothetical protein